MQKQNQRESAADCGCAGPSALLHLRWSACTGPPALLHLRCFNCAGPPALLHLRSALVRCFICTGPFVACAGSSACHATPTLTGPSEQTWTQPAGSLLDKGCSVLPSLPQTDVDLTHPSSLARPPSVMGFSKQGVRKRKTVGWAAASQPRLPLQALACTVAQSPSETHTQAKFKHHFK